MKNIKQARAIYYATQEKKYKEYLKIINDNNLLKDFEKFRHDFYKNHSSYIRNKVYYYFLKKHDLIK